MNSRQRALQPESADSQVAERDARPVPFLTQTQICQRFGISDETWRRWRKARRVPEPLPNIPGHPRWAVQDIEDFERGRYGAQGRVYFGAARRGR